MLDHPAMLPASEVQDKLISDSDIDRMTRSEFYAFAMEHLRWFMESYLFFRPEGGGQPHPLILTPHQLELHELFVRHWIVEQEPLYLVVAKHRKAYVTTYFGGLGLSLCILNPGTNGFLAANDWPTTEKVRRNIVKPFWDFLPPADAKEKARPFDLPLKGGDDPDDLVWHNLILVNETDPRTGQRQTLEKFSPSGGSYFTFLSAGSEKGGVSQSLDFALFTEAGIDGPNWDTNVDRTVDAFPKTKRHLLVFEGTGEHGGSFLNSLIDIAEEESSEHKLVFLRWFNDPNMRRKIPKGKRVQPTGTGVKRQRDAEELARIRSEFHQYYNIDQITDERVRQGLIQQLDECLYWRQTISLPRLRYNFMKFNSHHPTTLQDQRMSHGKSIFDGDMIKELEDAYEARRAAYKRIPEKARPPYPRRFPVKLPGGDLLDTVVLYHAPEKGWKYLVCVDSSEGVPGGDDSAIGVFGFSPDGHVVLAALHSGLIDAETQARVAFALSDLYRTIGGGMAMVSVEIERYGVAVLARLRKLRTDKNERPPLYHMRDADKPGQRDKNPGFRTDRFTRPTAIEFFGNWGRQWVIDVKEAYAQFRSFGRAPNGKIKGLGYPDDIVLICLQAAWIGVEWNCYRPPKPQVVQDEVIKSLRPSDPESEEAMIRRAYPELSDALIADLVRAGATARLATGIDEQTYRPATALEQASHDILSMRSEPPRGEDAWMLNFLAR